MDGHTILDAVPGNEKREFRPLQIVERQLSASGPKRAQIRVKLVGRGRCDARRRSRAVDLGLPELPEMPSFRPGRSGSI